MSIQCYIPVDTPTKYQPLWYHKQGLSQTASGYGARLTSCYMVFWEKKWRRVYVTCFSNVGTSWIKVKGQKLYLHDTHQTPQHMLLQ